MDRSDRNLVKHGCGGENKSAGAPFADIALRPSAGMAEAFQVICGNIRRQLAEAQHDLGSSSPDALHEMRVALRRLRAAIGLFPDALKAKQRACILADIKWISKHLSFARDIDVFVAEVVLPLKVRHPDNIPIHSLYRKCLDRKIAEYRRIQTALCSRRFLMFSRRIAGVVAPSVSGPGLDQPASAVAADSLARMKKKIKNGKPLKKLGRRELHKFRLRIKAMRYALELTGGLVSGDRQRRHFDEMLTSLRHLQSALGEITDIAARRKTFEKIMGRSGLSARSVRHRFAGLELDNARRQRKCLSRSIEAHERFLRTRPFWK